MGSGRAPGRGVRPPRPARAFLGTLLPPRPGRQRPARQPFWKAAPGRSSTAGRGVCGGRRAVLVHPAFPLPPRREACAFGRLAPLAAGGSQPQLVGFWPEQAARAPLGPGLACCAPDASTGAGRRAWRAEAGGRWLTLRALDPGSASRQHLALRGGARPLGRGLWGLADGTHARSPVSGGASAAGVCGSRGRPCPPPRNPRPSWRRDGERVGSGAGMGVVAAVTGRGTRCIWDAAGQTQ